MIRAQVSRMLGCGGERAKHTNYMEKHISIPPLLREKTSHLENK